MIGQQVGAYRIVEQIGEGGMGTVYRAEHVTLGRSAAIKVLHKEFAVRPEIVTRFFNEARAATQVSDPGIVQIFDFGQHVDGIAYIVMELLVGEALDRRLKRLGALSPAEALRIMRQVASSLGAAHARGIIHRDLKPDNIFLCPDPEVAGGERAKVLDFGIAKLTQDDFGPKAHTASIIGTPLYMSPEQCRGNGEVDARSDVYSLGCVLQKLLTGTAPFDATGTGELMMMHMQAPPPMPSMRAHGISPELDALVMRCLEKDPARRFSDGKDLAAAIDYLLGAQQFPAHAQRMSGPNLRGPESMPTTLSAANGVTTPPSTGSRKGLWIGAGAVAIAGAVAGIVIGMRGGKLPPAPPQPAPAAEPPVVSPAPVVTTDRDRAIMQIKEAITSFKAWTATHPHDDCAAADAISKTDPWGQALIVTCTDQPGDQIVGISSTGPDKQAGTADDLVSWQLGADVTELAHGARWKATPKPAVVTKPITKTKGKQTQTKDTGFVDLDGDGIPDKR
ncbi:MAG: serine/threonine-protein kinase [Kofleriaceae bacterium]